MSSLKIVDCPTCRAKDSIKIKSKISEGCFETFIEKCSSCEEFHTFNTKGALVKYEEENLLLNRMTGKVDYDNVLDKKNYPDPKEFRN